MDVVYFNDRAERWRVIVGQGESVTAKRPDF